MATRLNLGRESAPLGVSFTPAAGWEKTAGALIAKATTGHMATTMATTVIAANGTSGNDTLLGQWISSPLDSNQTITGTVKAYARVVESVATLDARSQLVIRVIDSGGTVRGTLLDFNADALSSEWQGSLTNRRFPLNSGSNTLTSVNAQTGDRIVMELGARQHATIAGNVSISAGDAATDVAENETGAVANAPWIEFSQTLTFADDIQMRATQSTLEVLYVGTPQARATQVSLDVLHEVWIQQWSSAIDTDTTSHTINFHGLEEDDLLIVAVSNDGTATQSWAHDQGFTDLIDTATAANRLVVKKLKVGGTFDTSLVITMSASERISYYVFKVPAARWDGDLANVQAGTTATGTGTAPNPPSLSPSWARTLWLVLAAHDDGSDSTSGAPSGEGFQTFYAEVGTTSAGTGLRPIVLEDTASSLDPGNFTLSASEEWIAATIGIKLQVEAGLVALEGSTAGTSTAVGNLISTIGLTGSSAGTSTAVGDLIAGNGAAVVSQVVVKLAGIGIPPRALLTQIVTKVAIGVNANIPGEVDLQGTSAGTSTALGLLNHVALMGLSAYGDGYEIGDPIDEPWAFGNLTFLNVALQGTSSGTSTAVGFLEAEEKALHGLAEGVSANVGNLTVQVGLIGSSTGSSTATGFMTGEWQLHGLSECGSFAQGTLMALREGEWGTFPPPNVPPERVVYIRYRGVDITRRVMYDQTKFKTSARGAPGTCTIRVRDDNHEFDFIPGGSITLDVGSIRQWGGYLAAVKRGFFFEGSHDSPGDIVRYIELRGLDYNVLLHKRVLYDKQDPTNVQLTTFPADTPDDEIIEYYAAHHLDLHGDGLDTTTLVEEVGTPSQDDEISGSAGWTWWQFLKHLRFHTGAIDYIDPDKNLVHTDVDTPNAPFGISDAPDETEVGCRELEIDFDASRMRNDALVWGVGQGSTNPVFSRTTDAASVTQHGLWQVGQYLPTVWRQTTVDRIADSWVYGSPQNKRGGKDDRPAAECIVFEPTFRVAQKVPLRSAVWEFEDVIPIRDIEIDFPTPWHPRFKLTLSHEIDDPWTTFEFWFPDFELPDIDIHIPEIPLPGPIVVTDPEGNIIIGAEVPTCNDGVYTYEVGGGGQALLDSGLLTVEMVYARANYPHDLPTISTSFHPSGNDYYLIDGNDGTGREGYRLSSKGDSIVWRSQVPLVTSGVSINQGMAGEAAEPGRHRSCFAGLYAGNLPNGADKVLVGTWGGPLPTVRPGDPGDNRTDPGGGDPTINFLIGLLNVKYIEVKSFQGWWFKGTGLYDFGGRWIVSEAIIGATCRRTILPDADGNINGGGGAVIIGPQPEAPEGEDPDAVYYFVASSWLEGTLMVFLDGILLQPGVDYQSNSAGRWIQFPEGFEGGDLYVRYYPLT